jgi:hypothetical protein
LTIGEFEAFVKTMMNAGISEKELTANYAFGLIGEVGEFIAEESETGVVKEAGDCLHYLVGLCSLAGINPHSVIRDAQAYRAFIWKDREFFLAESGRLAAGFAEANKKRLWHGRADLDVRSFLLGYAILVFEVMRRHGITAQVAMQNNVEKLKARYPNGFNVADSLARKDEGLPSEFDRLVKAALRVGAL